MKSPLLDRKTFRELLHLAVPMVVSQGAWALMVFADRFFMSRIDAEHIAATLGGGVAFFVTLSLFTGILSYANALVAQYYGAGQLARCPRVVSQAVLMALLAQPLLGVLAYFMADLFELMGHDPRQVELERRYYLILMGGSFFALCKTGIACYFAGIGRTRVVMIADVLGVMVNIPISDALIFGRFGLPQLDIAGAALGTVIATALSIGVYAAFYFNRVHRARFQVAASFGLDRGILRRYLRLGLPSGFEVFMGAATFNLFLLMFQSYGVNEGAAIAIVFNWDIVSYVPMIGLNIAVMTLIGRFVGAGDMTRTNQIIRSGFIIALAYSGTLAAVFVLLRVELMEVFTTPHQDFSPIRDLGARMMTGMATYLMADAIILICSGALRGAGDTRWLMTTSIALHLLMVVVQYVLIMVYGLGAMTSWWVFVAMILSLAACYLWRLLGGVWRRPERLARVMAE